MKLDTVLHRSRHRQLRLARVRSQTPHRLRISVGALSAAVLFAAAGVALSPTPSGAARSMRTDQPLLATGPLAPAGRALAPVRNATPLPLLPLSQAPAIVTQPGSEAVPEAGDAIFSALASGTPTPAVLWQISIDGGGSWTSVPTATSATYSFLVFPKENGEQVRAVFTNPFGVAISNPATLTVEHQTGQSSNWSGYAEPGPTFTSVAANLVVPTVTCSGPGDAYSSYWVGIDGAGSTTVEQDGIEADCVGGIPSYGAWYEMYGDQGLNSGSSVAISATTYPVAPGDAISESVSVAAGMWTLQIVNTTKAWTFSTTVPSPSPAPAESSAEWIVERPEICTSASQCALPDLANFGTATFTSASATLNGGNGPISPTTSDAVNMASSSSVLAATSALDPTGTTFSVTWQAAS